MFNNWRYKLESDNKLKSSDAFKVFHENGYRFSFDALYYMWLHETVYEDEYEDSLKPKHFPFIG